MNWVFCHSNIRFYILSLFSIFKKEVLRHLRDARAEPKENPSDVITERN